jgi:hypothetical protein
LLPARRDNRGGLSFSLALIDAFTSFDRCIGEQQKALLLRQKMRSGRANQMPALIAVTIASSCMDSDRSVALYAAHSISDGKS